MWQDGDGQRTVFPWSDAPAAAPYAVGDRVVSGNVGDLGTVVSVDCEHNTISVAWDCGDRYGEITYPADATFLRKAMPWEQ